MFSGVLGWEKGVEAKKGRGVRKWKIGSPCASVCRCRGEKRKKSSKDRRHKYKSSPVVKSARPPANRNGIKWNKINQT